MDIDNEFIFKSFNMGRELNTCGDLIYSGFESLEKEENKPLCKESTAFIFLYHISIAFERLEKIILIMKQNFIDESKYKTFINEYHTHSQSKLLNTITNINGIELNLNKDERRFVNLLDDFYNNDRYERFEINSPWDRDLQRMNKFICNTENLHLQYNDSNKEFIILNESILERIGRIVGKISKTFYTIICRLSNENNVYTYELNDDSGAQLVFLNQQKHYSLHEIFNGERGAFYELIYYFINMPKSALNNIVKIKPNIDIEASDIPDFLDNIAHKKSSSYLVDLIQTELLENEELKYKDYLQREKNIPLMLTALFNLYEE